MLRRSSAPATTACLAALLLAACGPGPGAEIPRLATGSDVDPLVLEGLQAAWTACEDGHPGALLELAKLYDANGLPELAARTYELCLARAPEDGKSATAEIHYHLGRSREQEGRAEDALRAFERAIELAPSSAPARWRAGQVLLELGRIPQAEAAFRGALALEPASVSPRLGLARIQLLRSDPRAAIELLAPLVESDPRERFVHGLLARAYRALGDEVRAAAELRREERAAHTTVVDPWTADVQRRATGIFAGVERANEALVAGETRAALDILEPLYQRRPDELSVAQMLAKALVESGQHERALEVLDRARATHPDQFKLELFTGLAWAGRRAHRQALEHLEQARALNPAYGPTLEALGEVQAKLGLHAQAEVSLLSALEAGSEDPRTALLLGQVQLEQGEGERALATLEKACADHPNSAAAWTYLAEARFRSGDPQGARASLAEAEKRDPRYERLETVRKLVESGGDAPQ